MQRFILRATPAHANPAVWNLCGIATEAHPNPGNFANRPKWELSQIGRRGGRKGGKARGVGGFHAMDPEKQHEIASRGGRAVNKRAVRLRPPEVVEPRGTTAAEGRPSLAPPGFNVSSTA